MDIFIKKIFNGKAEGDDFVHIQFQKFSRGEFKNKALINARKVKDKFKISTTAEYANELVRMLAEKIRENPVHSIEEKDSNEDFNEIFEAFYDTSFITSRRNKRLARRCVPKKYSERFNMKEGIKIEYGIQKTKLDSFIFDESINSKDKHKKKEIGKHPQS